MVEVTFNLALRDISQEKAFPGGVSVVSTSSEVRHIVSRI